MSHASNTGPLTAEVPDPIGISQNKGATSRNNEKVQTTETGVGARAGLGVGSRTRGGRENK